MRNPLSAILQCADVRRDQDPSFNNLLIALQMIVTTQKAFQRSSGYQTKYDEMLDITLEAADTIVQCSKHMKTIVDGMQEPGKPLFYHLKILQMSSQCRSWILVSSS